MDQGGGAAVRQLLEDTWREVLHTDQVGPDDNFFDLGGTSLEAVVVVSRLNLALGTDISDIGLFERPTIRAMTDLLRDAGEPADLVRQARERGERRRGRREAGR